MSRGFLKLARQFHSLALEDYNVIAVQLRNVLVFHGQLDSNQPRTLLILRWLRERLGSVISLMNNHLDFLRQYDDAIDSRVKEELGIVVESTAPRPAKDYQQWMTELVKLREVFNTETYNLLLMGEVEEPLPASTEGLAGVGLQEDVSDFTLSTSQLPTDRIIRWAECHISRLREVTDGCAMVYTDVGINDDEVSKIIQEMVESDECAVVDTDDIVVGETHLDTVMSRPWDVVRCDHEAPALLRIGNIAIKVSGDRGRMMRNMHEMSEMCGFVGTSRIDEQLRAAGHVSSMSRGYEGGQDVVAERRLVSLSRARHNTNVGRSALNSPRCPRSYADAVRSGSSGRRLGTLR
ncbi:hypothetical protein SeLEV6574_g06290 [Synchytrium endobioticum]|uniref:Uncharacterized protein n=1 Tax=Synchytrium endobioticum TaxID=286115 RepID=A0A507CPF5_9FUNG|nr:hypothetical protein SeLEV6574_g06290 [Synchytrium endobioticum]